MFPLTAFPYYSPIANDVFGLQRIQHQSASSFSSALVYINQLCAYTRITDGFTRYVLTLSKGNKANLDRTMM